MGRASPAGEASVNLKQFFSIIVLRMKNERDHGLTRSSDEKIYEAIGRMAADAGLSPPLVLKSLRADVRATAHPKRALTNLHRFLVAGFASTLLRDFQSYRILEQIVLELFSQSQFLADILVRQSELFHWLTSTGALKRTKTTQDLAAEASETIAPFQRVEKRLDALKRFQRRELLRIGARQILKEADVPTTSAELSSLADVIIDVIVRLGHDQLCSSNNLTIDNELAVIGLGKLGGEELNFSSDIDLMFVYDRDVPLESMGSRLSTVHEYYSRLAEFIVRRLSEHTGEGHFHRVDVRLRPEGHSGPLAMSRSAYLTYYELRGELWERQMLLKARVVAGNKQVGERWLTELQPFVYPKTLLGSPLQEIARIKEKIEASVEGDSNIKLGSGGIRDVEFIVQALQLLNAGTNVELRERNTLRAVSRLGAAQLLNREEALQLREAYLFLRAVEDRLQLLHGLQKHSLPGSREEKRVLARQLGFASIARFERELNRRRTATRSLFRSVFDIRHGRGAVGRGRSRPGSELPSFGSLLRGSSSLDVQSSRAALLNCMKEVPNLGTKEGAQRLFQAIKKRRAPDWAVRNFSILASAKPLQRTLQQAVMNEQMLDLLLLVCSRSSRLTGLLAQEPLLFESLVGRPLETLAGERGWGFLRRTDPARYRSYNEFKAALRLLVGETVVEQYTRELSSLADEIVMDTFTAALGEQSAPKISLRLALIALGKYGGEEITFGSDLDLILVYESEEGAPATKLAQTFARQFLAALNSVYAVDFRLRPEGKSSPLATDLRYYKEYLHGRASFWERQALLKARLITGDGDFGKRVAGILADHAYRSPLPPRWKEQVFSMRRKMEQERSKGGARADLKVGRGGLVDLEFSLQVLQLQLGREFAELRKTNSFVLAEEAVSRALNRSEGKKLRANLGFLRLLESFTHLNGESTGFALPSEGAALRAIAAAMGKRSATELLRSVRKVRAENRSLFNRILRRNG
jgi:glutamate-ammonia-ligase adenylyltransferase